MVHVFCLNETCRRVIHLGDHIHWNFSDKVKCLKCGKEIEVEIKDGKLISSRTSEEK